MAILYRTHCRDRRVISDNFYPFSHPDRIKGMIIGNDLDALLSAALLKTLFDWNVVAIYDYQIIWYEADCRFRENLNSGRYVAVDLDIYHSNIPGLGHHVLEVSKDNRLEKHRLSLNPNFICGVNCENFRNKYPLGTIHFLLWLFEITLPENGELLCWLADSSFINGQSHRFRQNVRNWVEDYFRWKPFKQVLPQIDTRKYEERVFENIVIPLKERGINSKTGQIRSRFNLMSGYQYQWMDPEKEKNTIRVLMDFIHQVTDWKIPGLADSFNSKQGSRDHCPVHSIKKQYGSLDWFLKNENIFSYAIPYRDMINYTMFRKNI